MRIPGILRRLAFVLALAIAIGACGGRGAAPSTPAPAPTAGAAQPGSPAATGPAGPSASAVAAVSSSTPTAAPLDPALAKVLGDVAGLRDLTAPSSLRALTVSRKDLPALLDRLLTPEDRTYYANTTTLYRLLGHLGPNEDLQTVSAEFSGDAVLAFYSPPDKALWLVSDQPSLDIAGLSKRDRSTLAHELVHALQDSHFNLTKVYQSVVGDLDRNLAWTCVVEGDAVTHQNLYAARYLAVPLGRPGGALMLLAAAPAIGSTPPSLQREFLLPYQDGATAINAVREKAGVRRIDQLLQDPPVTALILHPERLTSGWAPAAVQLPDLSGVLGSGWKRQSGGGFGEFELRNYLQLRLAAGDAASVAAGWDGDHYDVYVNGKESAAVFRVHFADAAAAVRFVASRALLLQRSQAQVQGDVAAVPGGTWTAALPVAGDTVTFAIASSRDALGRLMDALRHG